MTRPDVTPPTSNGQLETSLLANYRALLRFLRARGAGDSSEDLLQDLWLKARRTDAKHRANPSVIEPRAFLYRMAANLIADNTRAGLRRERRDGLWEECNGPVANCALGPSVETTLIAREQLRSVECWLNTMGARASTIFKRYRIEGASHAEIALERAITVSCVEKHLGRCYRALEQARHDIMA